MDAIDVFAGCGGASSGLRRAGFKHVLFVEDNPFAALSLQANFPGVPVALANLFLFAITTVFKWFGIPTTFNGLVWLSPPCQGVSSGGLKLGVLDTRNRLLFTAVDAAAYLPDAWIVIENVTGLEKGNAKEILDELLKRLRALDRDVQVWRIAALEWEQVQDRNRLFIIVAPKGKKAPTQPKPTQKTAPNIDAYFDGFVDHDRDFFPLTDTELPIYHQIRRNWQDGKYGRKYAKHLKIRGKKKTFLSRLEKSGQWPTQLASAPRGYRYRCDFIHWKELRHVSIGEGKHAMGLPSHWLLAGGIDKRYPQVGNAVMPFMASIVGSAILKQADQSNGGSSGTTAPSGLVSAASTLPINKILIGHALSTLREFPSESLNCCVTSPPYYQLRDYGVEGQLGWEPTVDKYIASLVNVMREVRRVLMPNGTLWLNMGDSHCKGIIRSQAELYKGRVRSDERGFFRKRGGGILGVPWRLALALVDEGWLLISETIWHKPAVIPLGGQRRPVVAHETIFLLAKAKGYYYGRDDLREKTGREMTWEQYEVQRGRRWRSARADDLQQGRCRMNHKPAAGTHPLGRDSRSVWKIAAQHRAKKASNEDHYATFPPDLAKRMILGGCPSEGVVLDPFMGSGTTALAALELGRKFVGIELNPKYAALAEQRIQEHLQSGKKTSGATATPFLGVALHQGADTL